MKLHVENLGPLREAEIDLASPMIVLTGPNNAGKTWLAWVTYARLQLRFAGPPSKASATFFAELESAGEPGIERARADALIGEAIEERTQRIQAGLSDVFGAPASFFESTKLRLSVAPAEVARIPLHFRFTNGVRRFVIGAAPRDRVRLETLRLEVEGGAGAPEMPDPLDSTRELLRRALDLALHDSPGVSWFAPAVIFPAERSAITVFARELMGRRGELVDRVLGSHPPTPEDVVREARHYPLPIRDALQDANRMSFVSGLRSPFADLADELERDVLGGAVSLAELGDLAFTPAAAPTRRLSLDFAASIVKSLASIVFHFRHVAKPGDLVIIDEPELNLHPDNQRKVLRFLVRAVNRGIRLIVSTHSDFILRELSNLVRLAAAGERANDVMAELKYDPSWLLRPEKLGVYFFNTGRADRLPVNENGFSVATIEAAIKELDLETQKIEFALGS